MTERGRSAVRWGLAAFWAAAIFWVSSQPNPFPFVPQGIFSHDKLLHALAYGIQGALVLFALARTRLWLAPAIALATVVATAYGATDEWHQSHVPNRDADPADLAADAAGALAGASAAALILRRRMARASIRA